MIVRFYAGNSVPMARLGSGMIAFPDRTWSIPLPRPGELWEVFVSHTGPRVAHLLPIRRVEGPIAEARAVGAGEPGPWRPCEDLARAVRDESVGRGDRYWAGPIAGALEYIDLDELQGTTRCPDCPNTPQCMEQPWGPIEVRVCWPAGHVLWSVRYCPRIDRSIHAAAYSLCARCGVVNRRAARIDAAQNGHGFAAELARQHGAFAPTTAFLWWEEGEE